MRRITKFRRSVRAISPIISVLLMIAIAVSAALVAFAWVSGYMDFTTTKVGKSIQIQSISTNAAYVQNVGDSPVTIADVYVDGTLVAETINYTIDDAELDPSETASIIFTADLPTPQATIKVVTTDGISAQYTETFSGATGSATPVWLYRKQITIQSSQVAGTGTHSNFPVLVSLSSDAQLAANALDNGDDIKFVADDGTTPLYHEIESFDGDTGKLVAWVNVPALSATSDTIIYMYYGNTEATNQQSPEQVWNTNYKGVWHLGETGTGVAGEYKDSTQNNNDGQGGGGNTNGVPSTATGKIGNAQDFESSGTADYINVGSGSSLEIIGSITIEAWVRVEGYSGTWNMIVSRQLGTGSGDGYLLALRNDGRAYMMVDSTNVNRAGISTGSTWYHVVGVANGSTLRVYINGVATSTSGATWTLDSNPVLIGAGENGNVGTYPNEQFDGRIDEVRISNTARSTEWIQTEYHNMDNPSSFIALGGETLVSP